MRLWEYSFPFPFPFPLVGFYSPVLLNLSFQFICNAVFQRCIAD